MANYRVVTYKRLGGYTWCNGYTVACADLEVARDAIDPITEFERWLTYNGAQFIEGRISALPDTTRQDFITVPMSFAGTREIEYDQVPPPQVCVFMTMRTARGRPGKKFYRYATADSDYRGQGDGATITNGAMLGNWSNHFETMLTALSALNITLTVGKTYKPVIGIGGIGIGTNNVHHGWFNRKQGAAGG